MGDGCEQARATRQGGQRLDWCGGPHRREAHAPSCLAPSCPIGYQSPRRRVAQSQAAARPGRTAAPRLERRFAQVLHANPPMTRALVAPAAVWNLAQQRVASHSPRSESGTVLIPDPRRASGAALITGRGG
eukprot:3617394-Prymnesium_polylepis.2